MCDHMSRAGKDMGIGSRAKERMLGESCKGGTVGPWEANSNRRGKKGWPHMLKPGVQAMPRA